jgi:hypothetical protein
MELEKLNYYAWAKFLESINEESLLYKVISKIETSLPERKPLDIFRKILFEEFESIIKQMEFMHYMMKSQLLHYIFQLQQFDK